jgi:hypothetical protein
MSHRVLPPLLLAALLGTAACTTGPTPYQPKTSESSSGYTDQQLAPNRYRVTYSGSSVTPRPVVENYLLLRSAEVTLAAGFSHFAFDTRDTQAQTDYYFDDFDDPFYGPRFGRYRHNWLYGARPIGPLDVRPITRYEAYAEIVMLTPEQARNDPRALDARDVMARLTPKPPPPPA